MRIGLFVPCYIDAFFPEVGIATLELLERFGHDVFVVLGSERNFKITRPADMDLARFYLDQERSQK